MSEPNSFTHGPLGLIFTKTALPIIFVMCMHGLHSVVDAMFLGRYVGPEALGAVTLIFPLIMISVALATLVSNGMSSILARDLGAGNMEKARRTFAGAHGLALAVSALLILFFIFFGGSVTLLLASGSETLAYMAWVYLGINCLTAPATFVLSVNSDGLRNEGRISFMALMGLSVSLFNIGFNYLLIAIMGWGVAGSAIGTGLAQILALAIVLIYRHRGHAKLHPSDLLQASWLQGWTRILALGAPQSLNFLGIALGSAAVILALQMVKVPNYETQVSAFGILTRVMTFVFMPLLGLTHAMQSIIGNNYGAQAWQRSDQSLRIALGAALAYCITAQAVLMLFAKPISLSFADDTEVAEAFANIVRLTSTMMWLSGPLIVIGSYFQAIGNATRAAILGLSKPYLFAVPLTFLLPLAIGEKGIWVAGPIAEGLLAILTIAVLAQSARSLKLRRGLFTAPA